MSKSAPRIAALGEIDELNCALGVVLAEPIAEAVRELLQEVQHDLFDLGGEVSIPGRSAVGPAHVARLDAWLERWNATLAPLKEFVLPGGARAAGAAHVARAVCRRAERTLVALAEREAVNPEALRYLNRLSDLLFVLARVLNRDAGRGDVLWRHRRESAGGARSARRTRQGAP